MANYELLQANAIDSLEETLVYLKRSKNEPRKIRIAIILLDNFIELFLKTYIAKEHMHLIFDKPSEKNSKTVTLMQAIDILEKLKYEFPDIFKRPLISLRDIRNKLHHSALEYSTYEWKEKVGEILFYIIEFDKMHGELFNTQKYVSDEIWSEIINLKEIFELHLKNAERKASENTDYESDPLDYVECPECGLSYVSYREKDGSAKCCFCNSSFDIVQCLKCGTWVSSASCEVGDCCSNCLEFLQST